MMDHFSVDSRTELCVAISIQDVLMPHRIDWQRRRKLRGIHIIDGELQLEELTIGFSYASCIAIRPTMRSLATRNESFGYQRPKKLRSASEGAPEVEEEVSIAVCFVLIRLFSKGKKYKAKIWRTSNLDDQMIITAPKC
jgi:hypothetical protein